MGSRTANAPTFENVFEGNLARTDIPKIEINNNGKISSVVESNVLVNDIQLRIMRSLINKSIKQKGFSINEVQKLLLGKFEKDKTLAELSKAFTETLKMIDES